MLAHTANGSTDARRKMRTSGEVSAITLPLVLATAMPEISHLFFILFFIVAWQMRIRPELLLLISLPFETDVLPFLDGPELKLWMLTSLLAIIATYRGVRQDSERLLLFRRILIGGAAWVLIFSSLFLLGTFVQTESVWSLWLEEMALLLTRLLLLGSGALLLISRRIGVELILRFQAGYASFLIVLGTIFSLFPVGMLGELDAYTDFDRVYFPFSNPNLAALYILVSLMAAVVVSARSERVRFGWFQPVLIAGLLLSGSRAGIGGFVFLLVLLLTLSVFLRTVKVRKTFYLYSFVGLSVTAVLAAFQVVVRLADSLRETDQIARSSTGVGGVFGRIDFMTSGAERIGIWALAWQYFLDNPLFGIGIRAFAMEVGRDPHSFWLGILAETGLLGLCVVLSGMVLTIRKLFLIGTHDSWLVQGLGCCMIAVAVFTSDRYFPLSWVFAGLIFSWLTRESRKLRQD